MRINKSIFPDRLLVLSNTTYFLGENKKLDHLWDLLCSFDCQNIAKIYLSPFGAMGFYFHSSGDLASIEQLKCSGSGTVPEAVMENEDAIHDLQERRMLFVNFIIAIFFGRISGQNHRSLSGAIYNGQDKVTGFQVKNNTIFYQQTELLNRYLKDKLESLHDGKSKHNFISTDAVDDAINFIQNILIRQNNFEHVDLQSVMVMNYQAAILHNQQHAAASLALNFSVIESLVKEIFFAYGLIKGTKIKSFIKKKQNINKISKNAFGKMTSHQLIDTLHKGKLIDDYQFDRLEKLRKKRNKLMHKGEKVCPKESGDCQTLVRDLWTHLIDSPFELISGWSYRR